MKKLLSMVLALSLMLFVALTACAEDTTPPVSLPDPTPEATNPWDALLAGAKQSVDELTAATGTLSVTGSAAVTAVPDRASISVGVSETAQDVAEAQRSANAKVNAILDAVKALGVQDNKIVTSNYSIYPQSEYSSLSGKSTLVGYQVSNTVTIALEDFSLLESVIDAAVKAGANEMYGINFDVSNRSELYREALKKAVEAAKEKAALLADASGLRLDVIHEVNEVGGIGMSSGRGYMNAMDMVTEAAADAGTSIQGGELTVSAQVEIVYQVKNP